MKIPKRVNSLKQENSPTTLMIYGEISKHDLETIKREFEVVGINVEQPLNKGPLLEETLKFVFSDFNGISYIRDGLLGVIQAGILRKVFNYFKTKRKLDNYVSFDKTFNHGDKIFTIYITCHYDHISIIEKQIGYILTPYILDNLSSGSRFYATGHDDKTVKIVVLERGTGQTYPLN